MSKRSAVAAAFLSLALVPAPSAGAADPTMPLSEVHQGMHCEGLSVVQGTTISSFNVDVLDVIAGDSATGGPMILVQVSGPAVEPGGIGAGFSGSPVYCRDSHGVKRNAGAISASVGDYGNKLALVTPIEEMLGESPTAPASARSDPALRRAARPLAGPLTETGLSARARRLLVRAGRRVGIAVLSVPAGPFAGYPTQTLRPGAAVTTAYSTGDVAVGAVGTVTYRDGQNVWAFGHPLDDAGARSIFLQDAYVFGVVPNPIDSEDLGLGTYKLASSSGHTVGTLTNDGDFAVVGRLGSAPPSIGLEASASERGTRHASFVDGRLADERGLGLGASAALTAPLALVQAVDGVLHSSEPVTLSVCVRFRVAERKRRLGYCNDYFSPDDAAFDLTDAAGLVEGYDFSPLTLQDITARAKFRRGVSEDVLLRATAPRRVRPGQRIRVRALVRRRGRGNDRRISFRMRVPRSLRPGHQAMVLSGTGLFSSLDLEEELGTALVGLFGGDVSSPGLGGPEPHSIGALAKQVAGIHRGVGITARFRHRGRRRLVYENGRVAFSGSARVRLHVVRRRSHRAPAPPK